MVYTLDTIHSSIHEHVNAELPIHEEEPALIARECRVSRDLADRVWNGSAMGGNVV
jgi:hypothetical protein